MCKKNILMQKQICDFKHSKSQKKTHEHTLLITKIMLQLHVWYINGIFYAAKNHWHALKLQNCKKVVYKKYQKKI